MDRYERRARREDRKNLWMMLGIFIGGVLASLVIGFLVSAVLVLGLSCLTDVSSDHSEDIILYGTPIIALACIASAVSALMAKK